MKILKKYILVASVILPVLVLILIKTFGSSGFKYDAKKWSSPSFNGSNIVNIKDIETLPGDKLIICLDNRDTNGFEISASKVSIPSDSILERKYLKMMRNHKGPLLLYSADLALSARTWMIISQTGLRNLYILTPEKDNEIFKNKFLTDTLTRPEL